MCVVRMVYLPEDTTLPVHFQCRTTLERLLAKVAVCRNLAVVKERSAFSEITIRTGRVGHLPRVNSVSLYVDEVDGLVRRSLWGKERKTMKYSRRIVTVEPYTASFDCVRFYTCRFGPASRRLSNCIADAFQGYSSQ